MGSGISADDTMKEKILFDFTSEDREADWVIVNDGVMGGLSQSNIKFTDDSTAVFSGNLSLENYGGFASTRTKPMSFELAGFSGILLRVRGDGRKYQFRIRTDDAFDGVAYRLEFETEVKKWKEIYLPFDEFRPSFRGRILSDVEPLDPSKVKQVGFLVADKRAGVFNLEIDWIKAVHIKNDE